MAEQTITITLHLSELTYDVLNKTHLTGKSRDTGENPSEVANMQANLDSGPKEEILRSIGEAVATLKNNISEYIFDDTAVTGDNILISDSGNISIPMTMPSNFNNDVIPTIASAMHRYIVDLVLTDWFSITSVKDAEVYAAKSVRDLNELRSAISKRRRPTRTVVNG